MSAASTATPKKMALVMSGSYAYILTGWPRPTPEFLRFVDHNTADIISFETIGVQQKPNCKWSLWWNRLRLAWHVVRNQHKYKAIVLTGEDMSLPLIVLTALRRSFCPVFVLYHGHFMTAGYFPKVMARAVKQNWVHYLCLADSLRTTLITRYGVPADRCFTTSYGVDEEFYHPTDTPPDTIASAGFALRDYATLMQAARNSDQSFTIAAPAPIGADAAAMPANVKMGHLGTLHRVRDLYARSKFVVVPMYDVPHACGYTVIAEAMATGKAVIATRTEYMSELIEDGVTGFYVPPQDPAALAEKIDLLANDPALAARMGAAGRKLLEEQFTLDKYVGKIEAAIATSLKRMGL